MTDNADFTGTWQLLSWTALKNGEADGYPMGEDAQGQIIYAADGFMTAFLMRADYKDSPAGTDATVDTCLSYGGAWQYDAGKIRHDVSFSSLPHWIGRPLVRNVDPVADGEIKLLTEPEFSKSGNRYEHALHWKRVG